MPLPDHAFTVHGGCNCRAIRYKIEVPAFNDRFLHPTRDQAHLPEDEKIRFPMSLICHCNDCRRGSGALITYAFASLNSYVSFQFQPRPSSTPPPPTSQHKEKEGPPPWIPASDIFPPSEFKERNNTFLQLYQSSIVQLSPEFSEPITRSFCARCGTNLTYNIRKLPEPWPRFLDVWTGTIDKEDLEMGEWLKPTRHCWIDVEVPWIGKLACEGSGGIPRHAGGSDFE